MKYQLLFFMLLGLSTPLFSQTDSTQQARADIDAWANVRKAYFKVTKDDSLFVTLNSDAPFERSVYNKGELEGFMEGMFFNANTGDIIGPLYIDEYAMLFKVASFDSTYRVRASHIYVKPEGKNRKDTLRAEKKANQYLEKIKGGASFEEMAKKYGGDETAAQGGDLGWLWEGNMTKEFETAILNANKGDVFVVKTPAGSHVVKVTEDKVKDKGRVIVIPLVKKL